MLAARLGVTKATLSRAFAQMQAEGLIGVERRAITLRNRERLMALAHAA